MNFVQPAAWTLAGSVTWSLAQWATVVFVSRLLGYGPGGDYALALAIVNPVMMLSNLQLRAIQATDAAERFRFWDFVSLRLWTLMAAAVAIVQFGTFSDGPIPVLLAVLAFKVVEALSDVYYGAFQHAGHLDWIAQSQIIKSALSLALVIMLCFLGQPLWIPILIAAFGMAMVWMWFDCDHARSLRLVGTGRLLPDWPPDWPAMRRLFETAFPLGVVMMLISLNSSIPRFALERYAGREALGVFAAVAAISQAIGLVLNAIGQAMTAPLARLANENQLDAFKSLFARGFATGMAVAASVTLACAGLGDGVLVFFFGPEAAGQGWYLVMLTAAGGITSLAGLCGYGLTALGLYRQQLLIFIPITAITAALSYALIPVWGMEGAAWATVSSATAQLAAAAFALSVAFHSNDWMKQPRVLESAE